MKLLVKINQNACLKKGLDAPHSTVTVDINPSELPVDVREFIAEKYEPRTGEYQGYANWGGTHTNGILVETNQPTISDVIAAVQSVLDDRAKEKAREDEEMRLANEAQIAALGKTVTIKKQVVLDADGTSWVIDCDWKAANDWISSRTQVRANIEVEAYDLPYWPWSQYKRPSSVEQAVADLEVKNNKIINDAVERLRPLLAKAVADGEQEDRAKANWIAAHGSETLKLRQTEGFKWRSLFEREYADWICAPLGAEIECPFEIDDVDIEDCETPTATQIKRLQAVRDLLAEHKDIITVKLVNVTYTPKTDDYGQTADEPVTRVEIGVELSGWASGQARRYAAE